MTAERVLPHDLDAERAVLGALLMNNAHLDHVVAVIKPGDFFRRAHTAIYKAILTLVLEQKSQADLVTVKNALSSAGELDECGGPAYISACTDGVPRSANAVHYAGIVREKALLRRAITLANELLAASYDAAAPAAEIIREADQAIVALQRGALTGRMRNLRETAGDVYGIVQFHVEHKGELLGVDTGFASINELTLGWQAGDMVVIAARPSIGKSAFVLNTLIAASRAGKRSAIFSLEMRRRQIEYRALSTLSQVPLTRIMSGYLGDPDFERIGVATSELGELDIEIDDSAAVSVLDIRAACRRLKSERGLDLVVIDYFQLMRASGGKRYGSRREELEESSRAVKVLADELSAPILLLSQLSRASEDRPDRRPRLTDLRETGALEQDADIVCFLHRKHHRESGTTQFIIEKQRNGPTGSANLTITRETQTFVDGGEDPPPDPKPEPTEEKRRRPPKGWKRG